MGQRIVRVNELLKREIGHQLHTNFQAEAVCITITKVDTSPDLRNALVHFSVVGGKDKEREAIKFLLKNRGILKHYVSKMVRIKYMPNFEFKIDYSLEKGASMVEIMNQLEAEDDPS